MFTPINEAVEVQGKFIAKGFVPQRFKWRSRVLAVEQVTLVTDEKNGQVKHRFYSVVNGGSVYRLDFNRDSESWRLLEIYCE